MSDAQRWYDIKAQDGTAEILIYDQIGESFDGQGQTAKQFAADLKALGKVKALEIRINSPGGSVFEGQAIYSQLKNHKATKTVYIDGLAASIASLIAMAGDEVVMPENAMLMIHDPSGVTVGTQADMAKMAEALGKMRDSMIAVYARKTGRDRDEISTMMADETWMTADDAIEMGFADKRMEPVEIAAHFDLSHFQHAPRTSGRDVHSHHKGARAMKNNETPTAGPGDPKDTKQEQKGEDPTARFTEGHTAPDLEAVRKQERERVAAIWEHGQAMGCQPDMLNGLITSDASELSALKAIFADAKARNFVAKESLKHMTESEANPSAGGPQDTSAADGQDPPQHEDTLEARCQREWKKNPNLKAEFGEYEIYEAVMRNQAHVRILTKK